MVARDTGQATELRTTNSEMKLQGNRFDFVLAKTDQQFHCRVDYDLDMTFALPLELVTVSRHQTESCSEHSV